MAESEFRVMEFLMRAQMSTRRFHSAEPRRRAWESGDDNDHVVLAINIIIMIIIMNYKTCDNKFWLTLLLKKYIWNKIWQRLNQMSRFIVDRRVAQLRSNERVRRTFVAESKHVHSSEIGSRPLKTDLINWFWLSDISVHSVIRIPVDHLRLKGMKGGPCRHGNLNEWRQLTKWIGIIRQLNGDKRNELSPFNPARAQTFERNETHFEFENLLIRGHRQCQRAKDGKKTLKVEEERRN